jgi:predicted HTH domain antitoxin
MGEVKAARDRTFKGILEIMEREGIDEEGAMVMILDLGLKDYVVELYRQGDVTIREAAAILGLNLRQTLEIVEKKIGGNVGKEEAIKALELAKKLADAK